jgi:hypothetical protein
VPRIPRDINGEINMNENQASQDLAFVRDLIGRTQRRVDAHAYQFIWWGTIVLLWYPLANVYPSLWGTIMGVALGVGAVGSMLLGWWNGRRPRIAAESTVVSRQLGHIVFACIGGGVVLSIAAPMTGLVEGTSMPTIWALVYAVMTYMVGIVYTSEWRWAGACILAAAVVAMFLPEYSGLIVGPAMGLGLIIPGLMAERRVARMGAADGRPADSDQHLDSGSASV